MLEKRVGYKFLSNLDVGKAGSLVAEHFFLFGKSKLFLQMFDSSAPRRAAA